MFVCGVWGKRFPQQDFTSVPEEVANIELEHVLEEPIG